MKVECLLDPRVVQKVRASAQGTKSKPVTASKLFRSLSKMAFTTPAADHYFEDYVVGAVHEFGCVGV